VNAPGLYFSHYLALLTPFLERTDVTDLYVNRPNEVWIETLGGQIERHDCPGMDATSLERFARQVASLSSQGISREHPLLSATLPDGARIQIIMPPATRGDLALAIRKHVVADIELEDYRDSGAFDQVRLGEGAVKSLSTLVRLAQKKDYVGLLSLAVQHRHNILVSGGTSTGKTTFLNALIKQVPPEERLILIEDAPELAVQHQNMVGLVAARSALGEAVVDMEDLLNASLRMRPDRIILGELRGPEAFTFLRAVNTGHPGSMTTVHAGSPERAIEQIVLLALQSGTTLDRDSITHYVRSSIDVFVQLGRIGGRRLVTDVVVKS
jgi:type IV secretion system protein VirB11